MRLFKTSKGIILLDEEKAWLIRTDWDQLVNREGLYGPSPLFYRSTQTHRRYSRRILYRGIPSAANR